MQPFFPTRERAAPSRLDRLTLQPSFQIFGQGNTCTYGGILRWGDYTTVRPDYPAGYAWVGSGWGMVGGNCGANGAYVQPHNVVFGRGRDSSDVGRWIKK